MKLFHSNFNINAYLKSIYLIQVTTTYLLHLVNYYLVLNFVTGDDFVSLNGGSDKYFWFSCDVNLIVGTRTKYDNFSKCVTKRNLTRCFCGILTKNLQKCQNWQFLTPNVHSGNTFRSTNITILQQGCQIWTWISPKIANFWKKISQKCKNASFCYTFSNTNKMSAGTYIL